MKLTLIKEVIVYDNLLDEKSDIHAWKPEECFPIKSLKDGDKTKLSEIIGVEVIFQGVRDERGLFDDMFSKYDLFVKEFITSSNIPAYLFETEATIKVKNKIRSYKGILPKGLEIADYIQVETPIDKEYTLIAALIKLQQNNIDTVFDFFHDSYISFIISSLDTNLFTEDWIGLISKNYLTHKGSNILNYLQLILEFCPKGNIIYRIGGDGGNDEVSLQLFCQKDKKESILKRIETIISNTM